jgi:hypothetical protein
MTVKPHGQSINKDEKSLLFTKLRQMHREQLQAKNSGAKGNEECGNTNGDILLQ